MSDRAQKQKKCEKKLPIPLFRKHPAHILKYDLALVFFKLPLVLVIFSPFTVPKGVTPPASAGKSYGGGFKYGLLQVVLLLGSIISVFAVVGGLLLVGPWGLLALAVTWVLYSRFFPHLQGDRVVDSKIELKGEKKEDEAWLYINGICTGEIQTSVNFLSEAFQRPVTGVHNKTAGFLFDLVECIIQRDFLYVTQDGTTTLYQKLKENLMDSTKKKVVLIAHSQGGIITSLILDALLADLPQEYLKKLEIYTFGNAANHFNSPITAPGPDSRAGEPIVKYIEHYANEGDFVAQIGVLNWQIEPSRDAQAVKKVEAPDTRFYGSLFKRNVTGHLLVEHYFTYMLDPSAQWPELSTDGHHSRMFKYLGGGSPDA